MCGGGVCVCMKAVQAEGARYCGVGRGDGDMLLAMGDILPNLFSAIFTAWEWANIFWH